MADKPYYTPIEAATIYDRRSEALQAGDLERFYWTLPTAEAAEGEGLTGELVPFAQVQALQLIAQEAQKREQEAIELARQQAEAQQAKIDRLQLELGEAKGELKAIDDRRYRPPKWWVAMFGGRGQ